MYNDKLIIIKPNENISDILENMINSFCKSFNKVEEVVYSHDIKDLRNTKLLFILELDNSGFDIPMLMFFSELYLKNDNYFEGSVASILVHSTTELATKRAAQDIIFLANNMGCSFIGHPMIEATNSLSNFLTWQKTLDLPLEEICYHLCKKSGKRFKEFNAKTIDSPYITVLYSSTNKQSNTLALWDMIAKNIKSATINQIHLENGKIMDCKGCSYKLCLHYGKQNSCFYGGMIVENVLPSIEKSDALVFLCPNYNDAIPANTTATINRLTVLYNKLNFYKKNIFGIIVSGNSGSDSVAKQLIGALNINKGFRLPPYATLTATANDPGSILTVSNIENIAKNFALNLMNEIKS